ncbi:hypothetical protein PInf_005264 [Phytophthora infestans]|nr:hypothetical protein PInf_005264 [Phytophthora infestans]
MVTIASIRATSIDHDTVQPFVQPEPTTDAEKAAIKFKPSLAWAIMYVWYFPKDMQGEVPIIGVVKIGVRHDWVNLVVWLDNPTLAKSKILATSASASYGRVLKTCDIDVGYEISKPPNGSDIINGITPNVRYDEGDSDGGHTIFQFHEEGEYQDLIQWTQLTVAAREALENTDFGDHANVPFSDAYFEINIKAASTYYECRGRRNGGTTSRSIWE